MPGKKCGSRIEFTPYRDEGGMYDGLSHQERDTTWMPPLKALFVPMKRHEIRAAKLLLSS